jgi:alkylation response protein AidB-like acyl-CoA dehydrogenase
MPAQEGATHASHGLVREDNPGPTMSRRTPAQEEAYTYRVYWGEWHQKLGELAMDVLGPAGEIAADGPHEWEGLQKMFLFSRADTIYGGTSQIQRNIIAERALGLPKEPRGQP